VVLRALGLRRREVVDGDGLTVGQQRTVLAVDGHRKFVVELGPSKLRQLARGEHVAELERDHVIELNLQGERGRVARVTRRWKVGSCRVCARALRGGGYFPGAEHDAIGDPKLATRERAHRLRIADDRGDRVQRLGG